MVHLSSDEHEALVLVVGDGAATLVLELERDDLPPGSPTGLPPPLATPAAAGWEGVALQTEVDLTGPPGALRAGFQDVHDPAGLRVGGR